MALDSRPRPVRRPARRRVPLLTAFALLVMAAALWFGGPVSSPREGSAVPAPRLQVAEAQIAATERAMATDPATDPAEPAEPMTGPAPLAAVAAAPVVVSSAAPVAAVPPAVAGPRAPPYH